MILGREVEISTLAEALAEAVAGRGRLVLVSGEAGTGKTTLVRSVADAAEASGAVIRWGGSWDGEGEPLRPWLDALRWPEHPACAQAAEVLAADDSDGSVDDHARPRGPRRLVDAVLSALRASSSSTPQVFVFEDLHWADTGTVQLLRALAPRLPAFGVLAIGTVRTDDPGAVTVRDVFGGLADGIELHGLGPDAVATMVERVQGRPPTSEEVATIIERTGGNPLFVTEVARLLASGSSAHVPARVGDVLRRRLARVGPEADRLLGVASAIGTTFDVDTLRRASELDLGSVLGSLDEAADLRLVVRGGDADGTWSFVHDLVRATRYEGLGSAQRVEIHRRLVDVLDGGEADPDRLLHHAERAHLEPEDARAASFGLSAARRALARLAWTDAADRSARAVESAPPGPVGDEIRAEAHLAWGTALVRLGGDPFDHFTDVVDLGRRHDRPEWIARAALGFAAGLGGFEVPMFDRRQIDLLVEAADRLDADAPLRPAVLARLSVALSFLGSDDDRANIADQAIDHARGAGDPVALGAALAARCDAMAGPDHIDDRLEAATEIVALGESSGDLALEMLGRRLRLVALAESANLVGVDAELAAFAEAADRLGDPLYSSWVILWRSSRAGADGRLVEAAELRRQARALGAAGGSANVELLCLVAEIIDACDRVDATSLTQIWEAIRRDHREMLAQEAAVTFSRAYAALCTGDPDEARSLLGDAPEALLDAVPRDQEWLPAMVQASRLAFEIGTDAFVGHVHDRLSPYRGRGAFEGLLAAEHGVTDRFLALTAARLGDRDATRELVASALRSNRAVGRLIHAHTLTDAARALGLGTRADRELAGRYAADAAAAYEQLGLQAAAGVAAELADRIAADPADSTDPATAAKVPTEPAASAGAMILEGDGWNLTYDGATVRIRRAKGLADLAVLLSNPGADVHVRVLEGVDHLTLPTAETPALDDRAVREYRDRLGQLEAELDEAELHADLGRAERLRLEHDALVEELTAAFGLGDRARSAGSDADERLRKAVSARVKASIERISDLHPTLGAHLRNSVHTGFVCRYVPERPVTWRIQR